MITIKHKKLNVENAQENIIYYPDLFSGQIITEVSKNLDSRSITSLSVGLAMITQKIYKPRLVQDQFGSIACIVLKDDTCFFEKGSKKLNVSCHSGDVLILGSQFRNEWKYNLPQFSIKLYEDNYLPGIYLNSKQRFTYSEKIKKSLSNFHDLPKWKQCIQKNIPLEIIGKGSYGNVFRSNYLSYLFAVKFSKLKPECIKHPYNKSFSSWHEVYFLQDILKPLIEKNICPNLPLIYDTFTCDNCDLIIDNQKMNNIHCVINIIEIASGNLKNYLEEKRSIEELESALFQIMAAIHTIQKYSQIMNFDVKKENILYYNVESGGYWHYKIKGNDYYVPNFGKLFILNDFGISRTMSPEYPIYKTDKDKTFRLGSRYAIVKDGKFIPFNSIIQRDESGKIGKANKIKWKTGNISFGTEFKLDRKTNQVMKNRTVLSSEIIEYLKKNNIETNTASRDFFQNPEVIPPFEFYNDTQDAIRMFTGGKRTTQRGNHKEYSTVPKKFIKDLKAYLGEGESAKDGIFSEDPSQVLASYFIESFFPKYMKKPENVKIIATYTI